MTDYEIVVAMTKFGGSFAQSLAEAWMKADLENQRKIKEAFPELWTQYVAIAAMSRGK